MTCTDLVNLAGKKLTKQINVMSPMQESTPQTQGHDEDQLFFLGRDYRVAANLVHRTSSVPGWTQDTKPRTFNVPGRAFRINQQRARHWQNNHMTSGCILKYARLLSHVQLFCNPVDCSPPGFSVHFEKINRRLTTLPSWQ